MTVDFANDVKVKEKIINGKLTDLGVGELEALHCVCPICDKPDSQAATRGRDWRWFVRRSTEGDHRLATSGVEHLEYVFPALGLEIREIQADLLVHRNGDLPRAFLVVPVVVREVW